MNNLQGQQIGDYIIGHILGEGGMGMVYQAFPLDHSPPVALKIMLPPENDPSYFQRFFREIELMEALDHPNIIPILGHGDYHKMPYLVMKLVSGTSLSVLMKRERFSPQSAWAIIEPITKALGYLHKKGIVHRDIKPGNILIEKRGENQNVYLGDFGLSKQLDVSQTLTLAGSAVGTLGYIAPEGAMGDPLDHRADIYSLTVVTYQMLLGELPSDPSYSHLPVAEQLLKPPRLPSSIYLEFPEALENFLMNGLQTLRDKRYQSVGEFSQAFFLAMGQLSREQRQRVY